MSECPLTLDRVGEPLPRMLLRLDLPFGVHVLDVSRVACRDQQIFISIQINVEKHRLPGPIGGGQTAEVGDLFVSAIATIVKQRIAEDLRAVIDSSGRRGAGVLGGRLPFACMGISTPHVHDDEVQAVIAIEVGEIYSHRTAARAAQSQLVDGPKISLALIDPDPVRRPEIVADVNVRGAVSVQIAKRNGQRPVKWRLGKPPAVFVKKSSVRPGGGSEVSLSI